MSEPSVASSVARTALSWFERSSVCQKKIPKAEWTVLAAIVLQSRCEGSDDAFRVLSAATGNKCLGRRDLNPDGLVVNDCHAEVLARRSLLRYLYAEALAWQLQEGEEGFKQKSLFERHPDTRRLVLKAQYSLHLFITETPCGDAAIYELRDDVVDKLVQQRTSREMENGDEPERSALRLTGAKSKRTGDVEEAPPDKRFAQVVGITRVKPGRSDLPVDKQTLSMSCSDKLAKWNALGLQGLLLLQWFEPIMLSSIVVSEDHQALSVVKQEEALRRAVSTRLTERGAVASSSPTCETCVITDTPQFSRRRTPEAVSSSLALDYTCQESHWNMARTRESLDSNVLAKFFSNFECECLVAATGFKQGAKKVSKMDRRTMERVASRVAKIQFFRAFHHVLAQYTVTTTAKEFEYLQLKRTIPLRSSDTTSSLAADDRRKQFFTAFNDWVGVPAMFKQFKL